MEGAPLRDMEVKSFESISQKGIFEQNLPIDPG
jgi:hypothetical protein